MKNIYYTKLSTPVGPCIIASLENKICWLSLNDEGIKFKTFINAYTDLVNSNLMNNDFNKFKNNYPTIARVIISKNISIIEDRIIFINVINMLDNYFNREKVEFKSIETIYLTGTDFQHRVWSALRNIEYGTTKSYKEVADSIGNSNAFRAVGNANGHNLIPIIVPCHRVIKNNGELGGFSSGLEIKQKLLKIERILN